MDRGPLDLPDWAGFYEMQPNHGPPVAGPEHCRRRAGTAGTMGDPSPGPSIPFLKNSLGTLKGGPSGGTLGLTSKPACGSFSIFLRSYGGGGTCPGGFRGKWVSVPKKFHPGVELCHARAGLDGSQWASHELRFSR